MPSIRAVEFSWRVEKMGLGIAVSVAESGYVLGIVSPQKLGSPHEPEEGGSIRRGFYG